MKYQEKLKTQLSFIKRSCRDYDTGIKEEALRIAVSLRVLFHDTKKSSSLLKIAGIKEKINLISTIGTGQFHEDFKDKFVISIPVMMSPKGVNPILGNGKFSKLFSANKWWNEVVMVQHQSFSRKDIILSAANQDGGAHVDSKPSKKTNELKNGIGTFTATVNGKKQTKQLVDHHFPMIRQFAYEVLNSPDLTKLIEHT